MAEKKKEKRIATTTQGNDAGAVMSEIASFVGNIFNDWLVVMSMKWSCLWNAQTYRIVLLTMDMEISYCRFSTIMKRHRPVRSKQVRKMSNFAYEYVYVNLATYFCTNRAPLFTGNMTINGVLIKYTRQRCLSAVRIEGARISNRKSTTNLQDMVLYHAPR